MARPFVEPLCVYHRETRRWEVGVICNGGTPLALTVVDDCVEQIKFVTEIVRPGAGGVIFVLEAQVIFTNGDVMSVRGTSEGDVPTIRDKGHGKGMQAL
jgi:hypothetical protein